jgi:hypothetical protein
MLGTGKAPERVRQTAALVERGLIAPVTVDGLKGPRYIVSAEQSVLEAAADWNEDRHRDVAFLAPLDPLMWDRRLLRDLWEFDYLWEVYVPEAKRRWGYYVLPILFGDRLVGRIEPRLDRAARTLRMAGLWWEEGFAPRRAEGFVPAMRRALRDYSAFVGATKVGWAPATGDAARLFGTATKRVDGGLPHAKRESSLDGSPGEPT